MELSWGGLVNAEKHSNHTRLVLFFPATNTYIPYDTVDICNQPLIDNPGGNTTTALYKSLWNQEVLTLSPGLDCLFSGTHPDTGTEVTIEYSLLFDFGSFNIKDASGEWAYYSVTAHQVD